MNRIEKLQAILEQEKLEALIIDNPIDLYYLTDQELSLGRLVVDQEGAILFVDGRYIEACQKNARIPVELTTGFLKNSSFEKWWPFSDKKVGFDAAYTTYCGYQDLQSLGSDLVPLKSPVKKLREIKDLGEIEKLRRAASLGSKGFDFLSKFFREGISEEKAALELEMFWRKNGGERLAFEPHIAFGEGSSQPHYHSGRRTLKKNEPILIDIGVVVEKYHSDMTRVIWIGEAGDEIKKIYRIVYEAYQAALALCKPGTQIGELDKAARDIIEAAGYGNYFPHSLGHGVGLEIHESPILRSKGPDSERVLEEGMVLTIEPGIYLPQKYGVRLEDTVVITKEGYENLTNRALSTQLPIFS